MLMFLEVVINMLVCLVMLMVGTITNIGVEAGSVHASSTTIMLYSGGLVGRISNR